MKTIDPDLLAEAFQKGIANGEAQREPSYWDMAALVKEQLSFKHGFQVDQFNGNGSGDYAQTKIVANNGRTMIISDNGESHRDTARKLGEFLALNAPRTAPEAFSCD